GERWRGPESREDLAGMSEDGCRLGRLGELEQATPTAEECERLLRYNPEPLPAIRGIEVGIGCRLHVATGLGERGVRGDERVRCVGIARLETSRETPGECGVSDPEAGPHECRQQVSIVRVV